MTVLRTLLLGFLVLAGSLAAQAGEVLRGDFSHSSVRLLVEREALAAGETTWIAFEITPRAGWHTYWVNPGDSGAAPILEWELPAPVTVGAPLFGVPERLPVAHLVNYGYSEPSSLLFPVQTAEGVAGPISVSLVAEWLVCEVECVPQIGEWSFELPVADMPEASAGARDTFIAARGNLPEPSYWDAKLVAADVSSELYVFADPSELDGLTGAYYYPEAEGVVTYAAEQLWSIYEMGLQVRMPRERGAMDPATPDGILELVFENGERQAYHLQPKLKVKAPAQIASSDGISTIPLWQAAIYAFLGGLILNLMPCVFPILSLKAFAFVAANYKTTANRRREGWAYTLGIWISFMAIVGVLMALRAGGAAIGWGFQLQEPLFVGLLAMLMVLVSLSLAGVFDIRLGFEHAGQELAGREGTQGAFFKGVLATLVATPCTAPLMAPAIGFALTQPIYTVVIVFSLLALGLALPFLLLSYSARIAAMMPKPGAWMETVKQGLAFPMLLTAMWLVYIYDIQAGATAAFALLFGMVILAFAVWLWGKTSALVGRTIAGLVAVFAVIAVVYVSQGTSTPTAAAVSEQGEKPYSEERLNALLGEGKPVFVYFTAEWCITCKVNEKVALHRAETQDAFTAKGVTVLKGDWTNRNDEIAAVLARYGRAGVPLYLYYPAGTSEAVVLPELITASTIIDVL